MVAISTLLCTLAFQFPYDGPIAPRLRPETVPVADLRVDVPLALIPVQLVRAGAAGPRLITALGQTGRLQLAFGALLTVGLAIRLCRRRPGRSRLRWRPG